MDGCGISVVGSPVEEGRASIRCSVNQGRTEEEPTKQQGHYMYVAAMTAETPGRRATSRALTAPAAIRGKPRQCPGTREIQEPSHPPPCCSCCRASISVPCLRVPFLPGSSTMPPSPPRRTRGTCATPRASRAPRPETKRVQHGDGCARHASSRPGRCLQHLTLSAV